MSNTAIRILPEAIRSAAFGAVIVTYTPIGTALAFPAHIIIFQNTTDQSVLISWDGVTDNLYLAAGSQMIIDVSSNQAKTGGAFLIAQGTIFYVKYSSGAPASGAVYLSALYGFPN